MRNVYDKIRFKAPPGISDSSLISPSFSLGQRNRAYWASQHQKSVVLQPQPEGGGRPRSLRGHVVALGGDDIMCKNVEQPDITHMTVWHMHFACWVPKAADTHS